MKVVSNSELIYLLINNELPEQNEPKRCAHVDWESDAEHRKETEGEKEHELHVLCSSCWKYVNQLQKINIESAYQVIYL